MKTIPQLVSPPQDSLIAKRVVGSHFHDAWAGTAAQPDLSALGQFLHAARRAPRWVDVCMTMRNRIVKRLGLKDLGELAALSDAKTERDYRVGDRVGIFTLFEIHPDEVLLGDRDKHLDVVLSVLMGKTDASSQTTVTVTTVVHVHNTLGRLYMLAVAPMHRLIAPAVAAHVSVAA
jgi:hypothetical protein